MDNQIANAKEEALSRRDILDKVEKWMSACEEESWLWLQSGIYSLSLYLSLDLYGSTTGIRTNGLNNVVCHSTWHHEIKINVYYNRPMGSHFKKIVVLIPFPNTYTCLCLSFPKYLVVENTESHTVDSTGTTGMRLVKMEWEIHFDYDIFIAPY